MFSLEMCIGKFTNNVSTMSETGQKSPFEQELFRDGVLVYDPVRDVQKATEDYLRSKSWYENNPYWDEQRTVMSLSGDRQKAMHDLAWQVYFSGRIPKRWDIWSNVMQSFEEAGVRGMQLGTELVNAGVSHEHHLVAHATGQAQRLDLTQLAFIFARDLPEWNRAEILGAQRRMGVSEREIQQAKDLAREKMSGRTVCRFQENGLFSLVEVKGK